MSIETVNGGVGGVLSAESPASANVENVENVEADAAMAQKGSPCCADGQDCGEESKAPRVWQRV